MGSNLLHLPVEILTHILSCLHYTELTQLSATCHAAYTLISPSRNQLLWQATFLREFDDPRDRWSSLSETPRRVTQTLEQTWDWFRELQRRVVALRHLKAGKYAIDEHDPAQVEEVIATILDIVDTAKSCPTPEEIRRGKVAEVDDRNLGLNLKLLPVNHAFTPEFDGLIRGVPADMVRRNARAGYYGGDILGASGTSILLNLDRVSNAPSRPTTRLQASMALDKIVRSENASRLHVLCGLTALEEQDEKFVGRARRLVYDWDLTDERNEYGPYKHDGSGQVDWKRLEAICTVAARQFGFAVQGRMILPRSLCFSIPYRTLSDPTVPEDWARAQGVWCGTYVFMHWEDLVEFNAISSPAHRPTLENGPEASGGLMKMELKLDASLKDDPALQPKTPICDDLPMLYFSGVSRSWDYQMTTAVRGSVCLAVGGREVRWRWIIYGSDQWLLEGVQPGGIRSGAIYGLWTSVGHDEGGPVGPVCYCPEELCKPTSVVLVS